jgi:predicted GH43/DUF377 family glycosyl hydrolase
VIYDVADTTTPYRMYYSGRGSVFGAIGYAKSADGINWVKHTGTEVPTDPPVAVLDHGVGGSADSFRAADPWVIKDGGVFKMWYTADDSNMKRVAYATSTDGVTWQKGGGVLSPDGAAGGNFGGGIFAPTVWKDGTTYLMLFVGLKASTGETKILSASSLDGIAWTTGNVSLNPQNGSFHASNFDSPAVFDEGVAGPERYKLYYAGSSLDFQKNFHVRIGLSVTSGGTGWQGGKFAGSQTGGSVLDVGTLGTAFDGRSASGLAATLTGDSGANKYLAFMSGSRGSDFFPRIGVAKSGDGATWTKVAGPGEGGGQFDFTSADALGQLDPAPFLEGSTYNLYFTGLTLGAQATSPAVRSIVRNTISQDAGTRLPSGVWSGQVQVLNGTNGSSVAIDASGGVSHPSVIKDTSGNPGTPYLMYYTGYSAAGVPQIGKVQSTSAAFTSPTAAQNQMVAGGSGLVDQKGNKDPVVIQPAAGDYRMVYTAIDNLGVERLMYATSPDGATWSRRGVVLNPSQTGFEYDEQGVRATGLVIDGSTMHVYFAGVDRTGRERAGHATIATPTPVAAVAGVPSGAVTYQVGNMTTSIRDWRSITRTSSGDKVQLRLSYLQPYSGTGSFGELWSDYFPVTTTSDVAEKLNLMLTVRGIRWQARLSNPAGNPTLDKVAIENAPVQFQATGSATTQNVTPPSTLVLTSWGTLTINSETFAPAGTGTVGGTVSVRNADTDVELIPAIALNTAGATTQSLAAISPAVNRRLRLVFNLTSSGPATPKVRSFTVGYTAVPVTEPAALFTATPVTGRAPLVVAFDASSSLVPAGRTITAYNWDFDGNGIADQVTTTPTTTHTYAAGTWTAKLTVTDSTGVTSAPSTPTTITATDGTAPTGVLINGPTPLAKPFQLLKPLALTWTAADAESGISRYVLTYRSAPLGGTFGAPVLIASGAGTSMTYPLTQGTTYCFTVIATNGAGLTASSPERCTALPMHSVGLTAKGFWAKKTKSGHYLSRYRVAKVKGATLLRTGVTVKRLGIIATRGTGMGTVTVYIGTTKLKTINLAATSTKRRQVISVANFTKVRKGTIRIVVATSGKPVIIEGLAISKV